MKIQQPHRFSFFHPHFPILCFIFIKSEHFFLCVAILRPEETLLCFEYKKTMKSIAHTLCRKSTTSIVYSKQSSHRWKFLVLNLNLELSASMANKSESNNFRFLNIRFYSIFLPCFFFHSPAKLSHLKFEVLFGLESCQKIVLN